MLIIVKYPRRFSVLAVLLLFAGVLAVLYAGAVVPAFNARDYWEKTGKVIWEVRTSQKMLALTFDDGPSKNITPQVLELLDKYDAKATFFVIGEQVEKYPEIVMQEASRGHCIGNHTYNHLNLANLSLMELIRNLERNHKLICRLTNSCPHLFRPPLGYYDRDVVIAAERLDYRVVMWSWTQDSADWAGRSGAEMARRLIGRAKPGNIILFHDNSPRKNTVDALKIILPELKQQGYRFVTLDELINAEEIEVNASKRDRIQSLFKSIF